MDEWKCIEVHISATDPCLDSSVQIANFYDLYDMKLER